MLLLWDVLGATYEDVERRDAIDAAGDTERDIASSLRAETLRLWLLCTEDRGSPTAMGDGDGCERLEFRETLRPLLSWLQAAGSVVLTWLSRLSTLLTLLCSLGRRLGAQSLPTSLPVSGALVMCTGGAAAAAVGFAASLASSGVTLESFPAPTNA